MNDASLAFLRGWFSALLKSYYVGFRYNNIYRIKTIISKEPKNLYKTLKEWYFMTIIDEGSRKAERMGNLKASSESSYRTASF